MQAAPVVLVADDVHAQLQASEESKDHMLTLLAQADAEKAAAEAGAAAATAAAAAARSPGNSSAQDHVVQQLQTQLEVRRSSGLWHPVIKPQCMCCHAQRVHDVDDPHVSSQSSRCP